MISALSFLAGYFLCFFTWRRRNLKAINELRAELERISNRPAFDWNAAFETAMRESGFNVKDPS